MTKTSLRAHFWRSFLKLTLRGERLPLDRHREAVARNARALARMQKSVPAETSVLGGIPTLWLRPDGSDESTVLLYLHGGGYVSGTAESYLPMCSPMAARLGMAMALPDYRLAPEHPFPAALEDALAAYRGLLSQSRDPATVVLAGDSAGGGLALALTMALRDAGETLPAALVCMSPWADLSGRDGLETGGSDPILRGEWLEEWAALYAGGADRHEPGISPAHGDYRGFPPMLIQVGSEELLLGDAAAVAERAREAGVEVTLQVWAGM